LTEEGVARHTADSLSVSCRDIRIDSSSRAEAWRRTLYAAQVRFGLRNYRYRAADGEYGLTIARVHCPDPYSLLVDSLDLRTLITDDAFARRHPYARDRFAVFVPRIAARELDIERFLRDDYVAERIQLTRPVVNVYRYKGRPRDPKPRRMPNEAVRSLPTTSAWTRSSAGRPPSSTANRKQTPTSRATCCWKTRPPIAQPHQRPGTDVGENPGRGGGQLPTDGQRHPGTDPGHGPAGRIIRLPVQRYAGPDAGESLQPFFHAQRKHPHRERGG
jgi:hypothetical protein